MFSTDADKWNMDIFMSFQSIQLYEKTPGNSQFRFLFLLNVFTYALIKHPFSLNNN